MSKPRSAGISDKRLLEVLGRGLSATKVVSVLAQGVETGSGVEGEGGEMEGKQPFLVEAPDFQTQHKYLDTALKLKSMYPKETLDVTIETFEQKMSRLRGEV